MASSQAWDGAKLRPPALKNALEVTSDKLAEAA
jgi:hypothetical protein